MVALIGNEQRAGAGQQRNAERGVKERLPARVIAVPRELRRRRAGVAGERFDGGRARGGAAAHHAQGGVGRVGEEEHGLAADDGGGEAGDEAARGGGGGAVKVGVRAAGGVDGGRRCVAVARVHRTKRAVAGRHPEDAVGVERQCAWPEEARRIADAERRARRRAHRRAAAARQGRHCERGEVDHAQHVVVGVGDEKRQGVGRNGEAGGRGEKRRRAAAVGVARGDAACAAAHQRARGAAGRRHDAQRVVGRVGDDDRGPGGAVDVVDDPVWGREARRGAVGRIHHPRNLERARQHAHVSGAADDARADGRGDAHDTPERLRNVEGVARGVEHQRAVEARVEGE